MADTLSNVRFTGKGTPRPAKIAVAAILVALVGLGLGMTAPPEESPAVMEEPAPQTSPESPAPADNAGDRMLEAGRDLADAIRGAITGPTPTPAPLPLPAASEVSSLDTTGAFSMLLGFGAVFLAAFAWFKRENRWASGTGIVLGVVTVALNAMILAVVATVFAVFAILVSWVSGSKGLARPAE
jgi:hypothetical protein